ncbi:A/G-specific adenine glycosylase [Candidatus Roizmanbacteria bacterium]|nr:A/G-specific adenine glycosylase [Candidatus Roizmanbacteria bacterium]
MKYLRRDFPWRNTTDPYHILVSEVMLQQTQVARALIKFPVFISQFSNFKELASASTKDVLQAWQGMGYNRRALYLKKIAEIIVDTYKGKFPDDPVILDSFPGIGEATASSIVAFAFNKPVVFIETNIRRVFIHLFFGDRKSKVGDKEIFPLIEKTLDKKNPREWYWALMDYGTYLGKTVDNPNKKSKHYSIQSKFEGSDRQVRGEILRILLKKSQTEKEIISVIKKDVNKTKKILTDLTKEQFVKIYRNKYCINN